MHVIFMYCPYIFLYGYLAMCCEKNRIRKTCFHTINASPEQLRRGVLYQPR
jgi:hypothetical protein